MAGRSSGAAFWVSISVGVWGVSLCVCTHEYICMCSYKPVYIYICRRLENNSCQLPLCWSFVLWNILRVWEEVLGRQNALLGREEAEVAQQGGA